MKNFSNKAQKIFMYLLSALLITTGTFLITGEGLIPEAKAVKEEVPFYSDPGDNLFMVEGYGDLVVGVIRKDDGSGYGPLGFCLAKLKFFPNTDNILYENVLDKGQFTWDLGDGRYVNQDQARKVDRAIFAFNFVHNKRLTNYGLSSDDTMSLYHATQIAIWSIAEGWTPSDVVKDPDTIANAELNALADKIHALYSDIYNYAINESNNTFEAGTVLLNVTADQAVANETVFDVEDTTQYRSSNGILYYRSPLMTLMTKQYEGVVWDGDFAFKYKVELENAPEGARVVNENGAPQTEFSTKPGVGSDFYIEIPVETASAGEFTVKVSTLEFRRLDTVLWHPITATGYQSLMQVGAIPDSGAATFKIAYPEVEDGIFGQIDVYKEGSQLKDFTTTQTEYGILHTLNYEVLPLKGAEYLLFIGDAKTVYTNMSDGKVYAKGGQMFRNAFATGSDGYLRFTGLPLDLDSETTTYVVRETKAPEGFVLNGANNADNEKSVTLERNATTTIAQGSVTFRNTPITFSFEVQKALANIIGETRNAGEGIVFGVFADTDIPTVSGGTVAKGSLVALLETNTNGKINSDNITLPVGYRYSVKELKTTSKYDLDLNTYYLDATIPNNIDDDSFNVELKDASGNTVTEIINYPKKHTISITKQEQYMVKSKLEPLSLDDTSDEFVIGFQHNPIENGDGYRFGIYSDQACQNLVEELTADNFVDNKFVSSKLNSGTYFVKELEARDGFDVNDKVYTVVLDSNKDVSIRNNLTRSSITVNKYDITYHRDNKENAPAQSGVKFQLLYNDVVLDELTTENGTLTFERIPVNHCYVLREIVPSGYVSETEVQTICLTNNGPEVVRVNNYLSEITGSIKVVKTDSETQEPMANVQFGLYEITDVNYENPLIIDVTNEFGEVVFANVANKEYVVKEMRAPAGYLLSEDIKEADLSNIKNGDTILLTFENDPYYGNVRLTKTDANNSQLFLSGAEYGLYSQKDNALLESKTTDSNGQIIFSKQPYGSELYVKEIKAPVGYKLSEEIIKVTIDDVNKTYYDVTATNSRATLSLTITKLDAKDNKVKLPNAVFALYHETDINLENPITTVATNNEGVATIRGLGIAKYIVQEIVAPTNYELNDQPYPIDLTAYKDGDIVNMDVYNAKKLFDLTVKKVWSGDEGTNARPEYIDVQLMNGKIKEGEAVRLGESNNWTYTFEDLEVDGEWSVKEKDVPTGYSAIISAIENNTITITNVYQPKPTTSITVKKVWEDDNDKVRPDEILIQLVKDGTPYGEAVAMSKDNNWAAITWNGLDPIYTWTVVERNISADYTAVISGLKDGVITITNTYHAPEAPKPEPKPQPVPPPTITERPDTGILGDSFLKPAAGTACVLGGIALLITTLKKRNK